MIYLTGSRSYKPFGPRSWIKDSWLTSMNSIWKRETKAETSNLKLPVAAHLNLFQVYSVTSQEFSRF